MRLEDMLKNVSGITNKVINSNCWDGQLNVLEGIQVLQSKVNEIIVAINNGIIKGDKGDTPIVKVGETTTLEPNRNASVTQTGDMLNPIFNFGIPKGEKGEKGDTGKASESINDNLIDSDHTFSSEKITNMFNSLQDVKGIKYETDKDCLLMNGTKNGIIKDLKLYGKSLVQVYPQLPLNGQNYNYNVGLNGVIKEGDYVTVTGNGTSYIDAQVRFSKNELFKPSTEYTFFIEVVSNSMKGKFDFNIDYLNRSMVATTSTFGIEEGFIGTKIIKAITKDVAWFNDNTIENKVILRTQASILNTGSIKYRIWALEGSHDEVVPFFKGITSVGNGNEIEVLSLNPTINYKDKYDSKIDGSYYFHSNGTKYDVTNMSSYNYTNNNYGVIKLDGKYTSHITFFNGNTFISGKLLESPSFDTILKVPNNCTEIRVGCRNDLVVPNIYLKQDKKPILFKDTDGAWKPVTELRGIDANSCDILDSTVNKLYRKYINVLLNGSEDISTYGELTTNTIGFKINSITNFNPLGLMISDKLRYLTPQENIFASDIEGISMTQTSFFIRISKSKLETQDVTGFKKWLQSNPVTVIYQLAQEKIYEVNPLDLQSFVNETMISFKYGLVNGISEFYVGSNLGSVTLNNMKRISKIENEVFQVKKIVLNGDYRVLAESTYPQDFKEVK